MDKETTFHVPVRPYSPIDALNRRAAAMGSPRYASGAAYADYNGHHVNVWWNSYRGYYIAEYFWAGRIVLARGEFGTCLVAALNEYDRGALGASVSVTPREDDAEALAVCNANTRLVRGNVEFGKNSVWWTWRHQAASESARDAANPRCQVRIFDWDVMQASETLEAYEAAVKAKHGRVWV
jgi:hypothetical protein